MNACNRGVCPDIFFETIKNIKQENTRKTLSKIKTVLNVFPSVFEHGNPQHWGYSKKK
jgi:hypothetical protein